MNLSISNAASHVAFLKYCRKHSLGLAWNLLMAFPGEKEEDYEELVGLIPKLVHFQPPVGTFPIMFQRYSRCLENPEQFGLELEPSEIYRFLYGDNEDRVTATGSSCLPTGKLSSRARTTN